MNDINLEQNSNESKYNGIYRAYVVDDEDPRDIGRIKVRIPGVFKEDVPNDHLPWALPATSLYRSGGDNTKPEMSVGIDSEALKTSFNKTGTGGVFSVPARGNHVWIWFDNGNHMHPIYFAMAPGEDDWLTQKQYIKDKVDTKIEQIATLKEKFVPQGGGERGADWGDNAFIDARQGLTTSGEGGNDNIDSGDKIKGNQYSSMQLNIDDENMEDPVERAYGTAFTMDVRPLKDKEDGQKAEYETDIIDAPEENGKNINRYITSFTTAGGTTIVIDNREEQENFYLIHKNYMENIDQNGSRKVFIGRNDPENELDNVDSTVRSNDELAIDGDKKIHVLGDFVTYAKGNILTQCDRNMQIDVNDTCGLRVKRGDFDIIINGSSNTDRNDGSGRDGSKREQDGDMNIDIQNGHLDVRVNKNVNVHVQENCNLRVNGDLRTTVDGDCHLKVVGNYYEDIGGDKYRTTEGNEEIKINGEHRKVLINNDDLIEIGNNEERTVEANVNETIGGSKKTNVSSDLELNVSGLYKGKIGSTYNLTIGSDIQIDATGDIGIKSSNFGVDTSALNVKASDVVFDASSFGVTTDANFMGDVVSGTVSLQNHTHFDQSKVVGQAALIPNFTTTPSPPSGLAVVVPTPVVVNPESVEGVEAESASNEGGDDTQTADRQRAD